MLSLCLVMRKVRGRDVEWWVWLLGELVIVRVIGVATVVEADGPCMF